MSTKLFSTILRSFILNNINTGMVFDKMKKYNFLLLKTSFNHDHKDPTENNEKAISYKV